MKFKKKVSAPKQLLLLDGSLKKLVELDIAKIAEDKYVYSESFKQSVDSIVASPIGKMQQLKYGNEAGRKLITQALAMAMLKPSRKDIENLLVAYVCIRVHIDRVGLVVEKKIIPDLAYGVWYLNDHTPTVQEVEEWKLTSQTQ